MQRESRYDDLRLRLLRTQVYLGFPRILARPCTPSRLKYQACLIGLVWPGGRHISLPGFGSDNKADKRRRKVVYLEVDEEETSEEQHYWV